MSEPFAVSGTMPFRILLDEAIRLARQHALAILPTVAVPVAVLSAILGGLQVWMIGDPSKMADPRRALASSCGLLLVAMVFVLFMLIAYTAMQVAALDATAGRPVDMGRAWRTAARPGMLGTLILQGLAVFASALACLFPMFYVFPLLSFSVPAAAEEGLFGTRALARSANLTQHNPQRNFWSTPLVKVLVLWVIGTALSYAVSILISLPLGVLVGFDALRKGAAGQEPDLTAWIWPQVGTNFVSGLVTTAVYLFFVFGTALLFFDTRNRREGTDLAAAVDAMTALPMPPTPPPPAPPSWDAPR
ncbi:MAG TPA: hypothetical protein VMW27_09805 [Thermoanaerobaculia bacterium]|nr:hypothetical protein [Thermoanaerobaculia bacterium]